MKKYLPLAILSVLFVLLLLFLNNRNSLNFIEEQKIIPTPTVYSKKYTCPTGEWIDCMPGPGVVKPQCQPDYLKWASDNCLNFKGAAL